MAALPPFADAADVEAIWRPLTAAETELATAWIAEASQQVRDEVPDVLGLDVDERIAAGSLSADTVRSVVARMVRRVLMNPEGARERQQAVDDYSEAIVVDTTLSSGEMFISPREMKRLLGLHGRRAFQIDTRPDPAMLQPTVTYWPWDQIPS